MQPGPAPQSELQSLLDGFEKELGELGMAHDKIRNVSGSLADFEPMPCEKENEPKKMYPEGSLNRLRNLVNRLNEAQRSLNVLAERLQSQISTHTHHMELTAI